MKRILLITLLISSFSFTGKRTEFFPKAVKENRNLHKRNVTMGTIFDYKDVNGNMYASTDYCYDPSTREVIFKQEYEDQETGIQGFLQFINVVNSSQKLRKKVSFGLEISDDSYSYDSDDKQTEVGE